jgi:Cu/Ag efflux protein CusF
MRAAVTAALLAAVLGGCGEAPPEAQPPQAAAEVKSAKGTGTVTAVDANAGTVTIEHGAMPEIGWSAMTMAFKADPALLAGIEKGDNVAFDLTVTDGRGEITALRGQ